MNDERIKLYRVDDSGVFGASAEYDNIDFKILLRVQIFRHILYI